MMLHYNKLIIVHGKHLGYHNISGQGSKPNLREGHGVLTEGEADCVQMIT
jgi:hypothetical protein